MSEDISTINTNYDASKIQVLEGLEAVRRRPGMYVGGTDAKALHHLVYEVVDNAIDEALAGYCTEIEVTIHEDQSVTVSDNGRGIPVDIHPTKKISALEVVLTTLHAGGKFGGGGYKVSGGLHGVGSSAVNALSEWMEARVYRGGKIYFQRYHQGHPEERVKIIGDCPEEKTGTKVTFLPDDTIFETVVFDFRMLAQRMREMAFLTKGLKIILCDDREDKKEKVFHYEGGIKEFVTYLNKGANSLYPEVLYFEGEKDNVLVEVALQHNDMYSDNTYGFVNTITTPEGGMHVVGFRNALTKTFNDYGRKTGDLRRVILLFRYLPGRF